MPTKRFYPQDWASITQALQTYAVNNLPSTCPVVWGYNTVASPQMPFCVISQLVDPVMIGKGERRMHPYTCLQFNTLAASTLYTATVNGFVCSYTSPAGSPPTASTVQAGLLAALATNVPSAFALNATVSTLPLAGVSLGQKPISLTTSANINVCMAQEIYGLGTTSFSFDIYSVPYTANLMGQLIMGLETPDTLEAFDTASIGVIETLAPRSNNFKPTTAPTWQNRSGFDLRLTVNMLHITFIYDISQALTTVGTFSY